VDDVVTTGATLEACGVKLQQMEGVQLSMATIAIANA
jgi:predicted amidophosphoribosyltransferase